MLLGAAFSPSSSPPSSPNAFADSSPASSPSLGTASDSLGGALDDDMLDLDMSPSADTYRPDASPAHPFSASTRAVKRLPQYERREGLSLKPRKLFESNVRHAHEQERDERAGGLARARACGVDAYLHDRLMHVSDVEFGDDLAWLTDDMHDPEEQLWTETIAAAVDGAENVILLNGQGLTYIPPYISDLAHLVVFKGLDDPKTRRNVGRKSKSLSSTSLVFGSNSLGVRGDEIHLSLAQNRISFLPCELFNLDTLVMLSLRGNCISEVPPQIGQLRNLRELNIANNQIKYLPSEIMNLRLTSLALDPNPFLPRPVLDGKQTNVTPTQSRFVPRTVLPLTEIALRVLLSQASDVHSRGTTSNELAREGRRTTVLETFDLPLDQDWLDRLPTEFLLILSACVPACIPTPLSPNATPHASPASRKRKRPHRQCERTSSISICPSPVHRVLDNDRGYRAPVFIKHAEERFTWEKEVAGQKVGGENGVPILWRGCKFGCLDFLDAKAIGTTLPPTGDDMDIDDGRVPDVEEPGGPPFSSEGFEFDDDD